MIGTVILAALLAALFWAAITGRIQLDPEHEPQHLAPRWTEDAFVFALDPTPPIFTDAYLHLGDGTVQHFRLTPSPPFDWSRHPDL